MSAQEKMVAARGYLLQLAEEELNAHNALLAGIGSQYDLDMASAKLNAVIDMLELLDVDVSELLCRRENA